MRERERERTTYRYHVKGVVAGVRYSVLGVAVAGERYNVQGVVAGVRCDV